MARRSVALFALLLASGMAAGQPRVGLVLGGGGARGAAHIGVLETLERLRVPVHCVAGTSMGGLVAGAWSSGINPAAMRAAMARADWADIFRDGTDFAELDLRNKRMTQRFLPGSELGVGPGGQLSVPAGVVTGQKIKQFINQLVRTDQRDHDISGTVLPLALIATDIGTGERVVMRHGNLSQAMRASMSVPGLLAPTVIDGRKLVDGGLVDNLPVQEVMALCQPDVVIAVSVGTPLLPPDQVSSLLSVTTQMVGILTAQNVARSIALLRPADIFIQPDLGDISAADFERHHEAAERGRLAAEALAPRLQALALSQAAYADWLTAFQTTPPPSPRVDAIEVAGLRQVDERAVSRHISQPLGQPLDAPQLRADLQSVYGDGDYENVDYSLVTRSGRNVLRVLPMEKSWGPDYLRFSLSLRSSRGEGSGYDLRAAYQRKLINRLGGELLAVGELGNRAGLSLEWYQPLDARRRFFFDVEAGYRREEFYLDVDDIRALQYQSQLASIGFAGGINLGTLGALRLGWHQTSQRSKLETGLPFVPNGKDHFGGLKATLDLDRLNDLHFPSHGWGLSANWFQANKDSGGYSKASVNARAAIPLGNFVIGGRLAASGSPRGELPLLEGTSLGGFLNLSAYSPDQLLGDSSRYAHVRAERIIGRMPIGLHGDLRLGAALEVGRIGGNFAPTRHTGTLYSLTAYLGGETPLGPVYLAASYGGPGVVNAYLVIGQP